MGITGEGRRFLLLQGPHGPFFSALGRQLVASGAGVWRVGFNRGDQMFWRDRARFIPFRGTADEWPETCKRILTEKSITDLVLYGDTRPIHAAAVEAAQERGISVHVFEEGYLRPHWITYERGASNGRSAILTTSLERMRRALRATDMDLPDAPARWGDMSQHVFWGALYHWFVLTDRRHFPGFRSHRDLTVGQEFRLYLKKLWLMPLHRLERVLASWRIRSGGFPFHLVLLQLDHDASFRAHSPYTSTAEFLGEVIEAFARGAPPHHHIVFKAHPLDDGRVPVARLIRTMARLQGIAARVHFVRGGKLAGLLNHARSAVTVNSTAGQQVLWRGLPLKAMGTAVYSRPDFVSEQPLADFFAQPKRPDSRAYREFRHYLLETSQITGGFYSLRGRRQLLRQVIDMILQPEDPYQALELGNAAPRQQLRLVK